MTRLWSKSHAAPGNALFVRVGTLDHPERVEPDVHIFTRSKLTWFELPPGQARVGGVLQDPGGLAGRQSGTAASQHCRRELTIPPSFWTIPIGDSDQCSDDQSCRTGESRCPWQYWIPAFGGPLHCIIRLHLNANWRAGPGAIGSARLWALSLCRFRGGTSSGCRRSSTMPGLSSRRSGRRYGHPSPW
jgi:hypothetical protein